MTSLKLNLNILAEHNNKYCSEDNTVLVESFFKETTRNGRHTMRLVYLAITRNILIIASSHSYSLLISRDNRDVLEMRTFLHPLDTISISVFKKTQRKTLKIFQKNNAVSRYFELMNSSKEIEDLLWAMWCKSVLQINGKGINRNKYPKSSLVFGHDLDIFNRQVPTAITYLERESSKIYWSDKYLYLGSKREIEDKSRPKPVPGLGPAEDIKLLYLKPQYFGCWDQSEHWVQCESSKLLK